MSTRVLTRWSIRIGLSAFVLGILLYLQLDKIVDLRLSLTVLNSVSLLSLALMICGSLAALGGTLIWAYRAPLESVVLLGFSLGFVAFLLGELVNINIHDPTAVFVFVIIAAALGAVVILVLAALRFAVVSGQKQP
jgi:hypothetical protein